MELIKRRGALSVVSAPSGAGKTTLCHEVKQLVPDLFYSVSHTTRTPRLGEVNGTDFHFVTEAEFLEMRDRDDFADLNILKPVVKRLGDRATLHLVEGGDHSFHVLKRSGRTDTEVMGELVGRIADWAGRLVEVLPTSPNLH